jgi:hypothetical protein
MKCPFNKDEECGQLCALYCKGENECAFKVIALMMIKADEKQ